MHSNQELIYDDPNGGGSQGSFWAVKGYVATTNRVSAGNLLTDQLIDMLKERARIEAEYASSLHVFSDKWSQKIGEGKEYGTTEGAWKAIFIEAERLSALHYRIRDRLTNEISADIKGWQKEHYKKTLTGLKERKDADSSFDKAQKPWEKRLSKMNKSKNEYHTKCKQLRSAEIGERNQQSDTSISVDQKRKNLAKVEELAILRDKTKQKYEQALREVTDYNSRYMEDMTEAFNKCQSMEAERQVFFKEMFFKVHRALDISEERELPEIYTSLHNAISTADSEKDLKWWSISHGIDMPMVWPSYEEWSPDQVNTLQRKVTRKPKDGIVLVNVKQGESPKINNLNQPLTRNNNHNNDTYSKRASQPYNHEEPAHQPLANGDYENTTTNSDSFDEHDGGTDQPKMGVRVRAIYDYAGDEDDELTFTAGTELEKIGEQDGQGWCTGKLDGKTGLYPASYCEEV